MPEELEIVTLRLFKGDKEELQEFYPNSGHNKIIRVLVHKHLAALKKRLAARMPEEDIGGEE